VHPFGPEVDDRQPRPRASRPGRLRRLWTASNVSPRKTVPLWGISSARMTSNGGTIWPRWRVIAVVLVTDHHDVGRLVDRLVASRIWRAIRVEDDAHPLGLDQGTPRGRTR